MHKSDNSRFATNPFVVTYQQGERNNKAKEAPKKPGAQLSKHAITREVLNRIVDRVKRI